MPDQVENQELQAITKELHWPKEGKYYEILGPFESRYRKVIAFRDFLLSNNEGILKRLMDLKEREKALYESKVRRWLLEIMKFDLAFPIDAFEKDLKNKPYAVDPAWFKDGIAVPTIKAERLLKKLLETLETSFDDSTFSPKKNQDLFFLLFQQNEENIKSKYQSQQYREKIKVLLNARRRILRESNNPEELRELSSAELL